MHQTRNITLGGSRFLAGSAWIDRPGPFLVLPALWVDWAVDAGVGVKIHRWTAGWARWRLQIDIGHHQPRAPRRVLDWKDDGLDGFLAWATEVFGGVWPRDLLERFLQEHPAWYRLVALGGPPAHYTRVLLARELIHRRASEPATQASGLDGVVWPPASP